MAAHSYFSLLSLLSSVSDRVSFRIRIEFFFLSPDWPKIRIRSGKIRIQIHEKNVLKLTLSTIGKFVYFIFSTLNTVLFVQVPPNT